MIKELKFWRDLPLKEKERIKSEHNVKVVTFKFICKIFEKSVVY